MSEIILPEEISSAFFCILLMVQTENIADLVKAVTCKCKDTRSTPVKCQITQNRSLRCHSPIFTLFLMSTCRHCCCHFSNANYLLSDSEVRVSALTVILKGGTECTLTSSGFCDFTAIYLCLTVRVLQEANKFCAFVS